MDKQDTHASKLTRKFQATIPQAIRQRLQLNQGDTVCFDVKNGQVVLRKASGIDMAYLKALEGTLSEWNSDEDDAFFHDL